MNAVYDFDGDGDLDILGTQGEDIAFNDDFSWAQNDGNGNFTIRQNIESEVGRFLQGTTVTPLSVNGPLEVLLSWQHGEGGTLALTVPEDPTAGTWQIRQLSPVSQGEAVDVADIDREPGTSTSCSATSGCATTAQTCGRR